MHDSRIEFPKALSYTKESFGHGRFVNFDAKVRKTAQNYENYKKWSGDQGVQFRTHQSTEEEEEEEEEEDSGVCSPPLWKNVPQKSPLNRPVLRHNRVQDIVRGQGELMEMVKNLPESSYELSLKDLVEQSIIETQDQEEGSDKLIKNHDDQGLDQRVKVKRRESMVKEKRAKMIRNGSIDNRGLFLKMVFPITFKSKKKNLTNNASSKVSPKPVASSKGADKEWWKKRFSFSSNSDNSRTSNSNGSTRSSVGSYGSRRRNSFLSSFWFCFHSK